MAKKEIVRRKRNGVTVVPVIFYAPEALHREIKRIVERQGTTQDALLNRWAAVNVANAKRGQELKRRQMAERKIEAADRKQIADHAGGSVAA